MDYNYQRYRMSNYDLSEFHGPRAGDEAIDFTVHRMDGSQVKLSDYRGRWVVIETGSLTCPMYVKNVNKLNALKAKYTDVEFLMVYVREAHPGSRVKPHRDLQEKIDRAQQTKDDYGDAREFLVDGVEGSMHQSYGSLPNMVYVVNPEGKVIYRCDWAFADRIENVLNNRDQLNTEEHVVIIGAAPWIFIPVTFKGGWDALWDLVIATPTIVYKHFQADIANLFGKKKTG
ncbi:MAG: redoxin domain-containing protein [Alphaproteobacteria bacterium]|nr:redoxin domain-containing protein [Alphaproteobacteria bacterium]